MFRGFLHIALSLKHIAERFDETVIIITVAFFLLLINKPSYNRSNSLVYHKVEKMRDSSALNLSDFKDIFD